MDESAVVAVDPGIAGCGVAYASRGVLLKAQYVRNETGIFPPAERCERMGRAVRDAVQALPRGVHSPRLVLEWPQVRTAGKGRGDPNDLLLLAGVDAAIVTYLSGEVQCVAPREWKDTIPPDVLISRVQDRLSEEERARVILPAKSLAHNVWDAVGIALWAVGRLNPRRVIARE